MPASSFASFAERFDHHCRATLSVEQKDRVLWVDAEVLLGVLTVKVVEEIERLEPYGMGNPRPLLVVNRVRLIGEPKVVGERKNHVQLRVQQGDVTVKAIAWNMADRCKALKTDTLCSLAFQPSINEWNGRREVQLEVKDIQVEGVDA